MPLKILLVDDHSMITDFYKTALEYAKFDKIITAKNTLESAYDFIFNKDNSNQIDIIFLDLSMPPYANKNINSGEDLANIIRAKYPSIKIIIISSILDPLQINRILKTINPCGLIDKIDISSYDQFIEIINKIKNGQYYRSAIVEKMINNNPNKIYLDDTNIKIITLIANGIKTKNIPIYLPITLSGAKKRKQKIKQLLNIDFGDDEDIIAKSKILGII